jgi:hypothetical protein
LKDTAILAGGLLLMADSARSLRRQLLARRNATSGDDDLLGRGVDMILQRRG